MQSTFVSHPELGNQVRKRILSEKAKRDCVNQALCSENEYNSPRQKLWSEWKEINDTRDIRERMQNEIDKASARESPDTLQTHRRASNILNEHVNREQQAENDTISSSMSGHKNKEYSSGIALNDGARKLQSLNNDTMLDNIKKDTDVRNNIERHDGSQGLIDFKEIGKTIEQQLKKQGIVFRTQLDIVYTIEALERVWLQVEEGLEEEDFVTLLSSVLSVNPKKLSILFQKMDANADGSLDWNEFLSYLLKEATHKWDDDRELGRCYLREGSSTTRELHAQVLNILPLAPANSETHPYTTTSLAAVASARAIEKEENKIHHYALMSSDRSIRIYDARTLNEVCALPLSSARNVLLPYQEHLGNGHSTYVAASERLERGKQQQHRLQRFKAYGRATRSKKHSSLQSTTAVKRLQMIIAEVAASEQRKSSNVTNQHSTQPVPTAMAYHESAQRLAVASSDRSVSFYAPLFDRRGKLFYQHDGGFYLTHAPQCLEVTTLSTGGRIQPNISIDKIAHFNMPTLVLSGDSSGHVGVQRMRLDQDSYSYQQIHLADVHAGHSVRKITLLPEVGVVSAGMDGDLVITDTDKWEVTRRMIGHKRGVHALAQCATNRVLVSLGYDANILIWDPYICHPTGRIKGHHSTVIDVIANESTNQLITASSDQKIKVYDIRTWTCIQSLVYSSMTSTGADASATTQYDRLSAVAYDPILEQFVSGGSQIRVWPVVTNQGYTLRSGAQPRAHHTLVVAICYSQVFKQVISVTVDERVCLWDVFTGKRAFEFRAFHGSAITAASLDHRGKRLLTAAHNGSVKIWNFNNGAIMHEFNEASRKAISALMYLPKALNSTVGIVSGSGVVRWPDPSAPKNTPVFTHNNHKAEVLCIAYLGDLFVSGATDGEIIVWYSGSAIIKKRIRIPPTPSNSSDIDSSENSSEMKSVTSAVTRINFANVNNITFGFIGTEDGSLHVIQTRSWAIIASHFKELNDAIIAIEMHETSMRLMVADSSHSGKIWDCQGLSLSTPNDMLLIRQMTTLRTAGSLTSSLTCCDINAFMTSSDSGEISIWTLDGLPVAFFGQIDKWPIKPDDNTREDAQSGDLFGSKNQNSAMTQSDNAKSLTSDVSDSEKEALGTVVKTESKRQAYAAEHHFLMPATMAPKGLKSSEFVLDSMHKHKIKKVQNNLQSSEREQASESIPLVEALDELRQTLCSPRQPNRHAISRPSNSVTRKFSSASIRTGFSGRSNRHLSSLPAANNVSQSTSLPTASIKTSNTIPHSEVTAQNDAGRRI